MSPNQHQKRFTPIGIRSTVNETGPLYHGTMADPKSSDFLELCYNSNYRNRPAAFFVYLTAAMIAVKWGAELAACDDIGRVSIVEPRGPII